uniref:Uncharacterized protein n=1 Tax=Meloidogyne enterolobii TaxID=390850 RepID=A0A6V7X827_MELEN|nr:unnamed protein product [Meloidogyne enterolobii]
MTSNRCNKNGETVVTQSNQLSEKARFIEHVLNKTIDLNRSRQQSIIRQLNRHEFKPDPVKQWKDEQKRKELEMCGEANLTEDEEEEENDGYNYLVGMALIELNNNNVIKLRDESKAKKKELNILKGKEWFDLYEEDLKTFLDAQEKKESKVNFIGKKNEKRRQIIDNDDEPEVVVKKKKEK